MVDRIATMKEKNSGVELSIAKFNLYVEKERTKQAQERTKQIELQPDKHHL